MSGEPTASSTLVTVNSPEGIAAEAYRTLRTGLLYSVVDDPPRVITFTSPGPREGKSATCSNLAVVLADAGKDVVLLDCDLRRPTIHTVFGLRNTQGIIDLLVEERPAEEVWNEPVKGLKVITAGFVPPNPAEILGSARFARLLASLRERFDYVLIDTPPIQMVADSAIVAVHSDGVLLIVDARNTRKRLVRRSIKTLEGVGADVLGTVLNNVKATDSRFYGYGSSYTQ